MPDGANVTIHYHRPPDRDQLLVQRLVYQDPGVVVTLLESASLSSPLHIAGEPAVEPGAAIVWFTFPGEWFDIGRFHLADGTFTGFYADILEPVVPVGPHEWRAVDLFLDVWLDPRGTVHLLDEDELREALERGWISPETGEAARHEAERILALARAGEWPPPIAREWTLERARAALEE